ncbi:hypothetical protein BC834DRAFT_494224 [Gloeopeniophorella convolvens]|nr:hypothetical protein BC834DRAFT_494224 [Gloeopeniophorella convolvens]
MSSLKLHPSLPAPVVHVGASLQAKSSVLTGVQDAYWSDEEEAKECPLCLEEMDISDLNFKPCQCEYQICRFCWNHIRRNLNNKCPACRRDYSDDVGQLKPINKDDQRRLAQQKKQRERERKDLDALGRRHLANVRVVQRNVVYVVGIGPRFAKEELISTLRSNDYFGQYGRISKIILVKRTPPGGHAPVVGLYITYHRREDAARCIAAVDGSASPGGGSEVMRASHGTTKYCMSFLRGANCPDHNCMNLHEWGDEKDCFTKEDLTTLQHTIKDTEVTRKNIVLGKKADDSSARLPRSASWAKASHDRPSATTPLSNHTNTAPAIIAAATARTPRRGEREKAARARPATPATPEIPEVIPITWKTKELKTSVKAPSIASSSRPSTPASSKLTKPKPKSPPPPVPPRSPTSSVTVESDAGSGSHDAPSLSPEPTTPAVPPGLPAVPPGLSAPPGLPPPGSRGPGAPSYQMSTQVQALLNDVKARRESALPTVGVSPFPDFDRTLQNLAEADGKFGGFSFNFDPKLAEAGMDDGASDLPEAASPFHGSFMDAFPALRAPSHPPGLGFPGTQRPIYDPRNSPVPSQASPALSYTGSFNPFAESESDAAAAARRLAHDDSTRKMSRFGFARNARQNGNLSSTSSPLISSTPLSPSDSITHGQQQHFLGSASAELPSPSSQWSSYQHHTHPFHSHNVSAASSPLVSQAQAQAQSQVYQHLPAAGRFQPFEQSGGVSEAALREFIQNSREQQQRANAARNAALVDQDQQHSQQYRYAQQQQQQQSQFLDPAIMSASFGGPLAHPQESYGHAPQGYGPPPGLAFPPGMQSNVVNDAPTAPSASPELPAEPRAEAEAEAAAAAAPADEKAARRAEKQAAAAERAAERTRRRAEKERERAEKKTEKERLEREKKEREKLEKERTERERAEKERAEREKAQRERERAEAAVAQKKAVAKAASAQKTETVAPPRKVSARSAPASKAPPAPTPAPASTPASASSPPSHGPLLSKMPKKNRPVTKPIRIPKEDDLHVETPSVLTSATSELPQNPLEKIGSSVVDSNSSSSRGQSVERITSEPTSVGELLAQIERQYPMMDLAHHPFFDATKLNPASKMPLEYGPLAHALSALSVGGGSFANSMPSGSVDNAVSSFQQLLETLTQTISDLLRLLPRTTWDDSSSFDGVLRDMLKGDDFLDDGGEDGGAPGAPGAGKDEVAALTLALERRARWMEVQLSKLEELHRDINTAAVRAVLAFNDSGWDPHGFAPRMGGTLQRFDTLGLASGGRRAMTADELEKKLVVAKEAAVFAETEVREIMGRIRAAGLPVGADAAY